MTFLLGCMLQFGILAAQNFAPRIYTFVAYLGDVTADKTNDKKYGEDTRIPVTRRSIKNSFLKIV